MPELLQLEELNAARVVTQLDPATPDMSDREPSLAGGAEGRSNPTIDHAAAEFLAGYSGAIEVDVDLTKILGSRSAPHSHDEVLELIERNARMRYGLRLLADAEREGILDLVVEARESSSEIRAAWALVDKRNPSLSLHERAQEVFSVVAEAVHGMLGKAWGAILVRLAECLRAVGLLRSPVISTDLQCIASEIAVGSRASSACATSVVNEDLDRQRQEIADQDDEQSNPSESDLEPRP